MRATTSCGRRQARSRRRHTLIWRTARGHLQWRRTLICQAALGYLHAALILP